MVNQRLLIGEVFISQCKVLINQSEAVAGHLAHQVGRQPIELWYQHPVKEPEVVIHRFRGMEDAPGNLLGAHPFRGHLHHDGFVGQGPPHVQDGPGGGQEDPEMLLVCIQQFSKGRTPCVET